MITLFLFNYVTGEHIQLEIRSNVDIKLVTMYPYFSKTPITDLKFPIENILKEFPDLEGKEATEIQKEAKERLKKHLEQFKELSEVKEYLINDLGKYGWKLTKEQRSGFR